MSDDDLIKFADETEVPPKVGVAERVWRVLIVDDEPDVHMTTVLAISDAEILGRRLEFLHANSAREGREVLEREHDIAVILLDVVMEETDSGLKLVETIRRDLDLKEVRIILRTGQPGYAPESDAVRDFDINDYKTKGDLTRNKLFASLTAAIRSYQQIHAINASRRGLEMILQASSRLMAVQGLHDFAVGVITQLAALVQVTPEGLVCAQTQQVSGEDAFSPRVVAAAGNYSNLIDQPLERLNDDRVRAALGECLEKRQSLFSGDATVLFFGSATGQDMAVFLDLSEPLDDINEKLISVFCNNIASCFDNIRLFSQLSASAYQDALCHLPNRVALAGLIDQARDDSRAAESSLVLVDVDRFSELNQAFGHTYGDKVLKAFAQRLVDRFGGQTVVARVGGDTFGLLGANVQLQPELIFSALAEPLLIDGRELAVQVTLGVLPLIDALSSGTDALKDANIALQVAKSGRRGQFCVFSRDMVEGIHERVRLLDELRTAFEGERLHVVYQPQLSLATRKVIGVEALLRWRTDSGDYVSPDRFIPLAEHSGLIVALGEWVLRTACREAAKLASEGTPLRMAVNLSVAQLRSPLFAQVLDDALADSKIDPALLELEITESMAMQSGDDVAAQIAMIKRRGIAVAIDDFGTGFSSLAYLEDLDVDRLKIDKAFVTKLSRDNYPNSIAATVTQLAKHLKLSVIAEGVETEDQLNWLREMAVDEGQGWLFAKAMPADELRNWMKSFNPN
jgi:diguanylate cyclase (GGDEF)-like protein